MKPILAIIFFAVASVCRGDTLRISELADAAGEGVERMILKTETGEEALFVKSKAVLGDSDVKQAWPQHAFDGQICVELNEEGGKKLKEATARMRYGRDRLAIIVDGRLISAPTVQTTLGSAFVIDGFHDKEFRDFDDLARKMSGRPPRPEGEEPNPPNPLPKLETVPFTEEEYQANKAMREKMGIFQIDAVPTIEDLNKVLRKGMTGKEVLKIFGKPYLASDKPHDDNFDFIYHIAPEKRPDNPKRKMLPDGFKVDYFDGKLSRWSHTYGSAPREEKVVGRQEPTLKVVLPEIDFSSSDLDLVAYVEAIVVPDPTHNVNNRDLWDLISFAMLLSSTIQVDGNKATMDADCDYMKTLTHNFPEVDALRKEAKKGRVSVEKLYNMLSLYAHGEKELPTKSKRLEQGGVEQSAIAPKPKSEDEEKPKPESEGSSH